MSCDRCEVRQRAEHVELGGDGVQVGVGGRAPESHLELVEDLAVPDLLGVPHVGVEVAVHLGRVGQHRRQLEHVAVDLELDPGHVVEHVAEAGVGGRGVPDREVDGGQVDGRVLGPEPVDVLDEPLLGRPGT